MSKETKKASLVLSQEDSKKELKKTEDFKNFHSTNDPLPRPTRRYLFLHQKKRISGLSHEEHCEKVSLKQVTEQHFQHLQKQTA